MDCDRCPGVHCDKGVGAVVNMKVVVVVLVALMCLCWVPVSVRAAPGFTPSEYLTPSFTWACDLTPSNGDLPHELVDGDPGASTSTYWEANDTYLYWGNATSTVDTSANWGVGRAIFGLDDPIGTSDYWQISATYWIVGITFLSPSWTQIGSYGLTTSGVFSSANIGVGILDDAGNLVYEQMHTSASYEGYWLVSGSGSSSNPPTSFQRPGSGSFWYDMATNTNTGKPWTLDEINHMVIIIEVRFQTAIFAYLTYDAGAGVAIALSGALLAVAPVDYTPTSSPVGSFILRPEEDYLSYQWANSTGVDPSDLSAEVNETTVFGDGAASYIQTTWNNTGKYAYFVMSDPPDWAVDTEYSLRIWIIVQASTYLTAAQGNLTFGVVSLFGSPPWRAVTGGAYNVPTTYKNYSLITTYNPTTQTAWTLASLSSVSSVISTNVTNPPAGYTIRVTQIAIICTPIGDFEFDDTGNYDYTIGEVVHWLANDGIAMIFALIGIFMMTLSPAIGVMRSKEGDGAIMGYLIAVLLFVIGLGFFWSGLAGHWV